ncbi:bifunctional SulP family inorganic anion transporter/carbonic anhydrase [Kibdelosporangium philippinense]|uniref:carbonic anhydrase n=1 Tax=Kibdelosporangium philippinense TaxID=211113 RepID=A0ABS8Z3J7_9PSEU|nr:bifunctional SulP family inorganic anion transporter/carbonic anhydrase [Kibdelosporangium philippinense]MCE7001256.1 bifunctional SulP family inorganic anion transporter/carbonic anhydrase [Kibdelosporangium philippinense]
MSRVSTVLRYDLPASFVVFLISVPLSLGIAAASGAPLIAGLVAAVVGGIVAGSLGGSAFQVSGPAAGMTVIVAGLVEQYGWPATAGITIAAGVVQILLGITKVGRLTLSLSPAVVHGMLAGIGITIVIGQLQVLFGGHADSDVLSSVVGLFTHAPVWGAVAVGAVTIGLMVLWPKVPRGNVVPAPLIAVVAATGLEILSGWDVDTVQLPDNPLLGLATPEVPSGGVLDIGFAVLSVALVASVGSLLSAVAVDKMHNGPRADLDRELIGQGAANAVSGALGGLPVAGVIVRSSTNVAAGARTRSSSILHGVWIALFVLFLANVLEHIPMAALAGVLIVVGVRLVYAGHLKCLKLHGELAVYAVTVLGVISLGLLEGVAIGVAVAVVRALYRLAHTSVRVSQQDDEWRVDVGGSLVFLGVGRLVRELRRIPVGQKVILQLHIDFMDHAAFEAIDDWRTGYEDRGGQVEVHEEDTWYSRARDGEPGRRKTIPWVGRWTDWERRTFRMPEPREPVFDGALEFERMAAHLIRPFLAELARNGQRPEQLFITCADSRVLPNLITSSGPGEQFCVRNIGNLVPPVHLESDEDSSVGAAIEFAVDVLNVPTIVVCGHSHCGAMKALMGGTAEPGTRLHSWLRNAASSLARVDGTDDLELLAAANVAQQLDNLRTYPSVRKAEEQGKLRLVGMYFDLAEARVYLVDPDDFRLLQLESQA